MRNDPLRIPKKYNSLVVEISRKYGIPFEVFASLLQQESAWETLGKHNSDDPKSTAWGLAGVTRAAAKDVKMGDKYTASVRDNLEAGARYLKKRYEDSGDWYAAAYDYHNGPGSYSTGRAHPDSVATYADEVMGRAGTRWRERAGEKITDVFQKPAERTAPVTPDPQMSLTSRLGGSLSPADNQAFSSATSASTAVRSLPATDPDPAQMATPIGTQVKAREDMEIYGQQPAVMADAGELSPRAEARMNQPYDRVMNERKAAMPGTPTPPGAPSRVATAVRASGPAIPPGGPVPLVGLAGSAVARTAVDKIGGLMDPIKEFAIGDNGGIHIGARAKDFAKANAGALITAGVSTMGGLLAGWAEDQEHQNTKGWVEGQARFTGADTGQGIDQAIATALQRAPTNVPRSVRSAGRSSMTAAKAKVGGPDVDSAIQGLGEIQALAARSGFQEANQARQRESMLAGHMAQAGEAKTKVAMQDADFLHAQSQSGMAFDQQAGEVYTMLAGAVGQLASLAFMDPYSGAIALAQKGLNQGSGRA